MFAGWVSADKADRGGCEGAAGSLGLRSAMGCFMNLTVRDRVQVWVELVNLARFEGVYVATSDQIGRECGSLEGGSRGRGWLG